MQGLAGLPFPAALGQNILNDLVLFVGITNIGMLAGMILGLYRTKSSPVRNKSGFIFSKSGLSGLFRSSPIRYVLDEIGGK